MKPAPCIVGFSQQSRRVHHLGWVVETSRRKKQSLELLTTEQSQTPNFGLHWNTWQQLVNLSDSAVLLISDCVTFDDTFSLHSWVHSTAWQTDRAEIGWDIRHCQILQSTTQRQQVSFVFFLTWNSCEPLIINKVGHRTIFLYFLTLS